MYVSNYFDECRKAGLVSQLPEDAAEGVVEKLLLMECADRVGSGEISEIALLRLEPGAVIKQHQHTTDSEVYIILMSGVVQECKVGDWHGQSNTMECDDKYIFAVKTKA